LNNPSNSIIFINLFLFLGFPDPLDLATGIEKKEMLLRLAGNDVSCTLNVLIYLFNQLGVLLICSNKMLRILYTYTFSYKKNYINLL